MRGMDVPLAAAARALAQGDPLQALKYVALRDDAQGLALRATALAQLGEYAGARALFKRAAKGFSQSHAIARARCVVALAEVALATRELKLADVGLARAIDALERHGDRANACHARLLHARHALSLGKLELAGQRLDAIQRRDTTPLQRALFELANAEIAQRRMQPRPARRALTAALAAARHAGIPALVAEVELAQRALSRPLARLSTPAGPRPVTLDHVAELFAGPHLVVDACRRCVRQAESVVSFETRPVLFALARCLAEAAPHEVSREQLIRVGFGMQRINPSLRARLRVAMGRLRQQLAALLSLRATASGFVLTPRAREVRVLLPQFDDDASSLLALLADGEAWSTSALALALGSSQRSVQRELSRLSSAGKVQSLGRAKSRRWLASPLHPVAAQLLVPTPQGA
jgi:tetratricopeptide (TPR) repeat protein